MIYRINIRNNFNQDKEFFLTADSQTQLFKRVQSQYKMAKESVTILEEYIETDNCGYELKKKHVKDRSAAEQAIYEKARDLYSKVQGVGVKYKDAYMEKHKMIAVNIQSEKDLYDLIPKYKKIKVIWTPTEKKGEHQYFALCK